MWCWLLPLAMIYVAQTSDQPDKKVKNIFIRGTFRRTSNTNSSAAAKQQTHHNSAVPSAFPVSCILTMNIWLLFECFSKIKPEMNIHSQHYSWLAFYCLPGHWVPFKKDFYMKIREPWWKARMQKYPANFSLCLRGITPLGKFMEMQPILLCWTFIYVAISF